MSSIQRPAPPGPKPPVAATLEQYRSLTPAERRQFLCAISDGVADAPGLWTTIAVAAEDLELSKSQVSRYVRQGKLFTNGKTSRHLRILVPSLIRMLVERGVGYLRLEIRHLAANSRSRTKDEECLRLAEAALEGLRVVEMETALALGLVPTG
jgi:hypothetical protein